MSFAPWLGSQLAQLGGADPRVLDKVPSARANFIQMGLVLIGTAGVAALSMGFAVASTLKAPVSVAVVIAAVWAVLILTLDRFLVRSLQGVPPGWRLFGLASVRLVIAALIGIIVSTPITLRIFEPEVRAEMAIANAKQSGESESEFAKSGLAQRITETEGQIIGYENVLRGVPYAISSDELSRAQKAVQVAEDKLAAARTDEDAKYDIMVCEKSGGGSSCGGSDRPGEGGQWLVAKTVWESAGRERSRRESDLRDARENYSRVEKELVAANTPTQVDRERAEEELARLRPLLKALYREKADWQEAQVSNTGLSQQLTALSTVGARSPSSLSAHIAVGLLFFMIELMPVLIKTLLAFNSSSPYDEVAEKMAAGEVLDFVNEGSRLRSQFLKDMAQRDQIEDDLRAHEIRLGLKSNQRVAEKMEDILDIALDRWAQDVEQTLSTYKAGASSPGSNAAPSLTPGGQFAPRRNGYAVPSSSTLRG